MKYRGVVFCLFFVISLMGIGVTYVSTSTLCDGFPLQGKVLLGAKEWVKVDSLNKVHKARIDTGATTSSISAIDILPVEKGAEKWVQFRFSHAGKQSEIFMYPIERMVRIKQSTSKGYDLRYVVKLPITIGNVTEMTQFTLRDRQHLKFPVLLGRSFLEKRAWVDVSQEFVQPKPSLIH